MKQALLFSDKEALHVSIYGPNGPNAPCSFNGFATYASNAIPAPYFIGVNNSTTPCAAGDTDVHVGSFGNMDTNRLNFNHYINCMSANGTMSGMPDILYPMGTIDPNAAIVNGNMGASKTISMAKASGTVMMSQSQTATETGSSGDKIIPAIAAMFGGLFAI